MPPSTALERLYVMDMYVGYAATARHACLSAATRLANTHLNVVASQHHFASRPRVADGTSDSTGVVAASGTATSAVIKNLEIQDYPRS